MPGTKTEAALDLELVQMYAPEWVHFYDGSLPEDAPRAWLRRQILEKARARQIAALAADQARGRETKKQL